MLSIRGIGFTEGLSFLAKGMKLLSEGDKHLDAAAALAENRDGKKFRNFSLWRVSFFCRLPFFPGPFKAALEAE